jgi:hypothetical protein
MEERKEKHLSDLEKMNAERRKAEEAYLESQQDMLNVRRIMRDGISNVEDLLQYVVACIEDARHMEDLARERNNTILYSETIAIRREFTKLLDLVMKDGSAEAVIDGTEEKFREENDGNESYA